MVLAQGRVLPLDRLRGEAEGERRGSEPALVREEVGEEEGRTDLRRSCACGALTMRRKRPWWLMTTTCFSGLERIKWRTHLALATFLSSVASNTPSLRFHSTLRSTSDQSSHGCGKRSLVSASGAPVSHGKAPHSCSCGRMMTGIGWALVDEGRCAEKPRSIVWRVRRNGETRMTVSAGFREAKKLG